MPLPQTQPPHQTYPAHKHKPKQTRRKRRRHQLWRLELGLEHNNQKPQPPCPCRAPRKQFPRDCPNYRETRRDLQTREKIRQCRRRLQQKQLLPQARPIEPKQLHLIPVSR